MKIKNQIRGSKNQQKRKRMPKNKTKISKIKPIKIRKLLATIPIILEIWFEAQTSKIFKRSKPLGYCQEYLCQWAKKVFSKKGIEK
jgi:hypothetical protein